MPILEAVAAAEDEGETASSEWIVERSGLTADEVGLGGKALAAAGYVDAQDATGQSETVPYYLAVTLLRAWSSNRRGMAGRGWRSRSVPRTR